MHIAEYQTWLEEYDRARGWDRVLPSQTCVHAMEELGEVARLVLYLDGYHAPDDRQPDDPQLLRARLAEELADCMTFLFKLAYQYGVDMETALEGNQHKATGRYSVEEGRTDALRYLIRQTENLERMKGENG
ncbi:MAG: MazG nucleotide pyrophosphohydrolase domain-containing protein [Chloroflexota bacterium]|nr:MazG nucleotide pyrophosphohydrolase domain-containing protein [Chloroflexota bacterium]